MRTLIIIVSLFLFSSCEDCLWFINDDDIPNCIEEEIKDFKNEMKDICEIGASVIKFEFQNEIVYGFDQGPCISDGTMMVLNRDCELICTLGTIAGITECNGEPFSNAIELEVLWEQ